MWDDFGLYPREDPFDPFSVMLFKALQVISFLFFLALLAISPDAKDGKVDPRAEFIITMDWPDNHPDDLDLFVQDPAGSLHAQPGLGADLAAEDVEGGLQVALVRADVQPVAV